MAEINLLQSSDNSPRLAGNQTIQVLNIAGVVLLVLAVIATLIMYSMASAKEKSLTKILADQHQLQAEITNDSHYKSLLISQKKLGNLQKLLDNHINWSVFFPSIFQATFKNVAFTKFKATKDGQADITGVVANFSDLDKLIQGYQLGDANSYIKDVKLVNIGVSGGGINGILFTIRVSFNSNKLLPNDLTQILLNSAQSAPTSAQPGR